MESRGSTPVRRATATVSRVSCRVRHAEAKPRTLTRGEPPLLRALCATLSVTLPSRGHSGLFCVRSAPGEKSLSRNGVRRPDADPVRSARFREAAREIVAKDRHDRKCGFPVDTAGAVARPTERAYRRGFADAPGEPLMPAASDVLPEEAIDLALIPTRPRSAF